MITRAILIAAVMALLSGLSWASNLTGPEGGWMNKTLTGPISRGSSGPPPTCSPGGPTGQMDFSVCSNIGITAATW